MDDFEHLADDLEADITKLGHDATVKGSSISDWIRQVDSQSQLIRLSVCRAVHDLLWTSGRAGFGEEHQTASLMGHLASQIGWYGRIFAAEAAASGAEFTLPDIRWAHQEKRQEANTGVDFGLLCNPSGDNNEDTEVRLVLLQAKLASSGKEEIEYFSVNHKTGQRGKLTKEEIRSALNSHWFRLCLKEAVLDHFKDNRASRPEKIAAALTKYPAGLPRYQLESLLRTQFKLAAMGKVDGPWCLYAVLRRPTPEQSPPPPLAVPLGVVANHLHERNVWCFPLPNKIPLIDNGEPCHELIAVLATALGYDASPYGLRLRLSQVTDAVGQACELLPSLSFVTSSPSESGGLALAHAIKSGFRVSPSLPQPRPLPQPAPTQRNPRSR